MPVKIPKAILWKAIRAKCLDCSAGSVHEISACPIGDCSLYRYRSGRPDKSAQEIMEDARE